MVDLSRMIQGGMDLATAFGRGDDAYNAATTKRAQIEGLVLDARNKRDASLAKEELSDLLMQSGSPADRQRALAVRSGVNPQFLGVGAKSNEAFTLSPGSKRFGADGKVIAEVPFAPGNMQYVDVPDGAGGTIKALLDPRTGGFQSPQFGGGPAPSLIDVVLNGAPARVGSDLTPEQLALAEADMASGGNIQSATFATREVTPQQFGTGRLGYTPKKQKDPPAGYQWGTDGRSLEMIPGGPAQVAGEARDAALKARKDAADAKSLLASQGEAGRQKEAAETANSLIASLDRLEKSPGFSGLGSAMGDFKQGVPYFRNDVKDSAAQLENIRSQVVLAVMSKLKALSSSGATGFGALSEKEMAVLQNAIASLDSSKISNAELVASIKVVRESMQKVAQWSPESAPAAPSADDGRRQSLLDKY